MKISRPFSSATITLENQGDLDDFERILSAASSHFQQRLYQQSHTASDMLEKLYLLGKDLKNGTSS